VERSIVQELADTLDVSEQAIVFRLINQGLRRQV
jgi:hypothetical protein